ncbi:MAG: hypothetical protein KKF27_21545 [Gammaproteobacteria bacterium]|nr:hypothetical protein [Gammaproteobacteria bacterium]
MLKDEAQAIDVISFLVTQYRKAFNHGGDYYAIEIARCAFCEALQNKLTEEELHILYLKGKIKADDEQLKRHKNELEILKNERR